MTTFVPPEPPEPPTLAVPLPEPEVGFGSPWAPADAENRDRILDWWRMWWRRVFFVWQAAFLTWLQNWLDAAAEYVSLHSVNGHSWWKTETPIDPITPTNIVIEEDPYRPLLINDLVSDTSTETRYGQITVVLDATHATVEPLGKLQGVPGPNSIPADVAVAGYLANPASNTSAALDPAITAFINNTGSDTRQALDLLNYGHAINLDTWPGADPTATVECHAAIQAAFDAALALGVPIISREGEYLLSAGVTLKGPADLSRARFTYTGTTGTCLTIGGSEGLARKVIHAPFVVAIAKTMPGWSQVVGTIGIRVVNTIDCTIYFSNVWNFERGIDFDAVSGGYIAYCKFFLTGVYNNKIGVRVGTDNSADAFNNKNEVYGGNFNYSDALAVVGSRHIYLDPVIVPITSWTFLEPSLQDSSGTAEYVAQFSGQANAIVNAYYETTIGQLTISWFAGSMENLIDGGVNSDKLIEAVGAGALNRVNRQGPNKTITANHTTDATDYDKLLTLNGAGAITISLPNVAYLSPGTRVTLRNVAATAASVVGDANTINGSLTPVAIAQWKTATFESQLLPTPQWIQVLD